MSAPYWQYCYSSLSFPLHPFFLYIFFSLPLSLLPSILSSPLFLPIPPPHPCKSVTESALRLLGDGGATHKEDSLPSESLSKASFTFSPAAITCGAGRGGPLLLFCSEATSPRNSATVKGFGFVNAAIPGGFLVPGNLRCNLGSAMACPQKTLSRALLCRHCFGTRFRK